MRFLQSRRDWLAAALATSALAACGGGDIQDPFEPARGVLLDGAGNSWARFLIAGYGAPFVVASGGPEYSLGSAPVTVANGTASLAQRVDAAIALGLSASDLVIVSGGVPDIVAIGDQVRAGLGITQGEAAAAAAGIAMAAQVRRLANAGARHVLVANAYDVRRTPYAIATGNAEDYRRISRAFNDELKVAIADLFNRVLLVDAELYFNELVGRQGTGYGLASSSLAAPACQGSTPGNGTVSATSCTSGAFAGNDPATFLFYDPLYLTPAAQKLFGDFAYNTSRNRW